MQHAPRHALVQPAARPVVRTNAPEPIGAQDELTGLLLRKGFLATGREMLAESAVSGRPLSLAVIDVDHFKSVNDTFGHLQGDDVLRAVAVMLRDTVRTGDLVGRYAGDEFVVLFPDTTLADARVLAARLCEASAHNRLTIRERP